MSRYGDFNRDPCPWVILNDTGGAFSMGAIGGGIWHFVKGAKNSPKGERIIGSIAAVKARSPILGGNFAVWGGLFSTFDCAIKGIRQKEDPWNLIASGFFTGGVLAARGGVGAATRSACFGAIALALIEGVSFAAERFMGPPQMMQVSEMRPPSPSP